MTNILRDTLRSFRSSPIFAFYILASLVVAVIIGLITFDIINLGMTHFGDPAHRTHDVAYGALFTTGVVGVLAQLRRPAKNVAGMVMALLPAGGLLLTAALSGDMNIVQRNPLRYAAWVIAVAALLHPAGRGFFRSFRVARVNWVMLALVGAAAVPFLSLAATNVRLQRTVTDVHASMGHFGFMAAFSYTVIAVGILASLRPVGWRLTAWVAGLLSCLLGATSLLYPDATSSLATAWALAAIVWGVAFVAAAELTNVSAARASVHPPAPRERNTSPRCEEAGEAAVLPALRGAGHLDQRI